ncbi:MAG: hypothetical protein LBN42_02845, partial [Oscillospiraceae bacterium]|nr:hypothetical protein [Oscillospiraceae bacterium]
MPIVILGIFSDILDWVLDKIFSPVFNFIAKLLSPVFEFLFNTVLSPILKFAMETVFPILWDLLMSLIGGLLYQIMILLWKLLDAIQSCFDILIGTKPVTYTPTDGPRQTDKTLLEVLFEQPMVMKAFIGVLALGIGLAFIFAIVAVARSSFDLEFEGKRPVMAVLRAGFKALLNFMFLAFFAVFIIRMSGVILTGVIESINFGESGTTSETQEQKESRNSIANIIFIIGGMDAAKTESFNTNPSLDDNLRRPYYNGTKKYSDSSTVLNEFNMAKYDFLTTILATLFVGYILLKCLLTFVQRIFEILMLYIVSPLFVSTMPLDDGAYFTRWREEFLGKIFTGFGSAISMRLYLMFLPLIMGGNIDFTGGGSLSGQMNYVIKLIFVLGGAWAVGESGSVITSLISASAGQKEQATNDKSAELMEKGANFVAEKYGEHKRDSAAKAQQKAEGSQAMS